MTEAQTAIAELTEISSQVQAAVLFDGSGAVAASTLSDAAAGRLAASAKALFESAASLREGDLTQVEAATGEGSLFVAGEGDWVLAAVTGPKPTAGLVFYDLRSCLRRAAETPKAKAKPRAKPKRRPKAKGDGTP
jgi:predicted regulator of Ras-like GTPase activity (Roadblock/LC7/MglB family)